ncbi:hypothetical protein [Adlercreutzia sp. ZJ304]|uniref:hypothetical protein n=1 Tax=Adlercreutzia sp. ZJ304 TaxID=2709791 RepID=UPI0013ED06F9|nr:hypothetical protein [Adlercreutzia sp. ZJ304]
MQTEFVTMDMENNPAWNAELEGYKPVIKEWAAKGYSYCGFVPVKFGPTGKTLVIDLVFQKA